jgi:hypothetical protein
MYICHVNDNFQIDNYSIFWFLLVAMQLINMCSIILYELFVNLISYKFINDSKSDI